MLFLGIIAIFQILFLPGFLILRRMKLRGGFLQTLLFTVGLSLVANYCLVFLLTVLGIYTRNVLITLFIIECGIMLLNEKGFFSYSLSGILHATNQKIVCKLQDFVEEKKVANEKDTLAFTLHSLSSLLFFILAVLTIYWIVKLTNWNIGNVFDAYDTIAI